MLINDLNTVICNLIPPPNLIPPSNIKIFIIKET